MNARACALFFAFLMGPSAAFAQGFAGLGTTAEGFALPSPERQFNFPADHGAHPSFRIEWWYVTANLMSTDGREFGVQWTLFRSALAPEERDGWESPQVWMGHAALTTEDHHFVAERLARGGVSQAGVVAEPFTAWIDEWSLKGSTLLDIRMYAQGSDFAYDLDLSTVRPFVPQGVNGYSVKSREGQASHYYSQPFYSVSGVLSLPDGPVEVTGTAWLDREWSSQPLSERQTGWDWFSLAFEDGARLMGFVLREDGGDPFTAATWIAQDGTPTPYADGAFFAEPLDLSSVAGREIPTRWRVTLPARDLDVTITAMNKDAWMDTTFPYWEGPVRMTGSHSGRGYLEMTGYE